MKLLGAVVLSLSLLLATFGFAADSPEKTAVNGVIIDVRTSPEFQEGHLEGALNIPYDKIGETIQAAVPNRSSKVILYCRSGRRSGIALETLKTIGYEDVTNLKTVKEASEKLGIPVIKGNK
jgi:phage shock protein E